MYQPSPLLEQIFAEHGTTKDIHVWNLLAADPLNRPHLARHYPGTICGNRTSTDDPLNTLSCWRQVPGFTFPVQDIYLEEALALTGYQDALLGVRRDSGRRANGSEINGSRSQAVPSAQRAIVEEAIMNAFLHGNHYHFDMLLEVCTSVKTGLIGTIPEVTKDVCWCYGS